MRTASTATSVAQSLLIPAQAVMNGFCYAYSLALLEKLSRMIQQDRVFVGGNEKAKRNPTDSFQLTEVADAVCSALGKQTGITLGQSSDGRVSTFYSHVSEFLAIFEAR
jgi:hypothetical protein